MFDDDDLTWGDVARASEAEEPKFDTRARVSSAGCHHQGGMTQLQAIDPCLLFH